MANTNAIANAASQIAGLKAPVMGVQVNKVFLGKAFVYVFGTKNLDEIRRADRRLHSKFRDFMFQSFSEDFKALTRSMFDLANESFNQERNAFLTSNKPWPALKKSTQYLDGTPRREHPILVRKGDLKKAATGGARRFSGNPGTISRSGIKVTVKHEYNANNDQPAGTMFMMVTGPKARHLYGFSSDYKPKGGKKTINAYTPPRPWWPKFDASFYSNLRKRTIEIATRDISMSLKTGMGVTQAAMKNKTYHDYFKR
jgi:hypothetical protein